MYVPNVWDTSQPGCYGDGPLDHPNAFIYTASESETYYLAAGSDGPFGSAVEHTAGAYRVFVDEYGL